MAGGITYADLRFARSPGEEPSEGELTYENLQVPRGLEKEAAESGPLKNKTPELPCWAASCHRWRPVTNRLTLGALALCLFLLATNIALGIQYLQASRQLQQASRDHAAKSHVLAERTHHLQTSLEESWHLLRLTGEELSSTKKELNSTTEALWQSRAGENQTLRQLQHWELQLNQTSRSLALLQRERESMVANLSQASSCRRIGCCPHGWTLFRWKCLWASSQRTEWWWSNSECEKKSSRLLVLKPWLPQELWEAVGEAFSQEVLNSWDSKFWVGLLKEEGTWKWVDGSRYEGSEIRPNYRNRYRAVIHNGQLSAVDSSSSQRYRFICERVASPEDPPTPLSDWGI